MSALHTLHALRSQHTTQGKCGCCWNQIDKDHPSNARTICSCGKHEPCIAARLIDDAIAEVEALRATLDHVQELVDDAALIAVHCGGGNLVTRRRLVDVADLRRALN